jgi:hypothetical protein
MRGKTAKEKAEGNGNGKSKVDVTESRKGLFSRDRFMNGSTRGNQRSEIINNERSKDFLQNKLQLAAVEVKQGQIEFKGTKRSFDIPSSMIDICNSGRGKGIRRKIRSDELITIRVRDFETDKAKRDSQKRMILVNQVDTVGQVHIIIRIIAESIFLGFSEDLSNLNVKRAVRKMKTRSKTVA